MTNESIHHHPSQELLVAYSAGTCTTSQALCIATHLDFCAKCRAIVNRNNAIGGALLNSPSSATVSANSKSQVMELITKRGQPKSEPSMTSASNEATSASGKKSPRALRKLLPDGMAAIRWKLGTLSVKTADLFKDQDGTSVSLLKIKPGGKVGRHRHLGDEYTVILQGSFSDETGVYRQGDFLLRDASQQHTPVATKDIDCICLTAQEAPLQFTGRWWSIFNPLLRKGYAPN